MKRRTVFGIGVVLLLLMAVALPAAAAGPWADTYTDDCPGCGHHYQHRHGDNHSDKPTSACDQTRKHLRDGSCESCPNQR